MNRKALFIAAVLMGVAFNLNASQILPTTIDRVADDAVDSFCGLCKARDVREDPDRFGKFVTYTFEVHDVMKGDYKQGETISFTQLEGYKGAVVMMTGSEYCLMLNKPSSSGMRSPVALSYGAYNVGRLKDGQKVLRGAVSRQSLMRDVLKRRPELSKRLSKNERDFVTNTTDRNMDYNEFVNFIRALGNDKTENRGGR